MTERMIEANGVELCARSLVLISTSLAAPDERRLPPCEQRLLRFLAGARVDWSDPGALVDHVVEYWRVLWGQTRAFDEAHIRALAEEDVERARDSAAAQNHGLLADDDRPRGPLSAIAAPTLVIHGTDDPMFPLAHGAALADAIPGATLLPLQGAGHGIDPADWDTITWAVRDHTRTPR